MIGNNAMILIIQKNQFKKFVLFNLLINFIVPDVNWIFVIYVVILLHL